MIEKGLKLIEVVAWENSQIPPSWPEKWWDDKEFMEQKLSTLKRCPLVARVGKNCLKNDPDGPTSCKCIRCQVQLSYGVSCERKPNPSGLG